MRHLLSILSLCMLMTVVAAGFAQSQSQFLGVLYDNDRVKADIAMHPSGDYIIFSQDERLRRMNLTDGERSELLDDFDEAPQHIAFSLMGETIFFTTEAGLYSLVEGEAPVLLVEATDINALAVSRGDRVAIGTEGGAVIYWPEETIAETDLPVNALAWMPGGGLVSGHDDGVVNYWVETGVSNTLQFTERHIRAVAVRDDAAVAFSDGRMVFLREFAQDDLSYTWEARATSLAFNGDTLLGAGGSLYLWDSASGEVIANEYHANPSIDLRNAVFAPDGSFIVGGGRWLSVWGNEFDRLQLTAAVHDPVEEGEILFQRNGCNGCHFEYSSGAPTMVGLAQAAAGRVEGLSPAEYIYQGIVDPDAYVPQGFPRGIHPAYYGERLTHEQVLTLVAYITSLEPR